LTVELEEKTMGRETMALSDEMLASPAKLARTREELEAIVSRSDASAGFLVDEEGNPFATVGHVEFRLPHPLAGLVEEDGAAPILEALLGETGARVKSCYLVERLTDRCLVVLAFDSPIPAREREELRERARALASCL
jgi:hypothetical protein